MVIDTGARAGELCELRLGDLADDLATVEVVRRPQSRRKAPLLCERYALSDSTRAAVRAWLDIREGLVATGEVPRPVGMPLQPRGLARTYATTVANLNADMASEPGWEPLPARMEQLRRSVAPVPVTVEEVREQGVRPG